MRQIGIKCCLDVPQIVEHGNLKTWKTECKKDLLVVIFLFYSQVD